MVKVMKVTALTACISLLFAVPVFAGNNQGFQNVNPMNNIQFQQNGMQNNMQQQQKQQQQQQLSNAAKFMVNKGIIMGDTSGNNFEDVDQGSYYYDAVNAIRQLGIAKGDGENFNPNQNMTLQEAILFVERALEAAGIDYSDDDLEEVFEDRSLSDYATREDVSAILYAVLGEDYLETAITDEDAVADTITLETDEETAITFDEDDFNDVCDDATGETLSYVKFTIPSSSYGKLYYGYEDSDDYDGKVSSTGKFYYDPDDDDDKSISDVTFVPTDDFTGTVKIHYTGYNTDGDVFTGTVKISVE